MEFMTTSADRGRAGEDGMGVVGTWNSIHAAMSHNSNLNTHVQHSAPTHVTPDDDEDLSPFPLHHSPTTHSGPLFLVGLDRSTILTRTSISRHGWMDG